MPNIIVKNGYIKSSQHLINYMTYAGEKFEAQTLIFEDGHKMEIGADEIIDFSQYDDVKYVQVEFKDGNIRKFKPSTYENKTEEESDLVTKNTLRRENGEEIELPPDSYLEYMSQRPSVEYNPNCSHGLFDINGAVDIEEAKRVVLENEKSIKWTPIISLRREDAERVGFDNRKAWESLLKAKAYDIAKLYNISPENMVINAAFHKKDDHPHLHLFIFSKDSREGFIKDGTDGMKSRTEQLKSLFNNTIFKDDVACLAQEKNQYRQEFKEEMKKTLQKMSKKEYPIAPEVLQSFSDLSDSLLDYQGKPSYEFMTPDVKKEVNVLLKKIIELDPNLKALYQSTMQNQRAFVSMYADREEKIEARLADFEERFFQPKKKDQKTLHNIIVKNALLVNQQGTSLVKKEKTTKKHLTAKESFALGELYLSGEDVPKDIHKVVEHPKASSAERVVDRKKEPVNQYAQYTLGKMYLSGEDVPKDVDKAMCYLMASAEQDNSFAQYKIGMVYYKGIDVIQDKKKAKQYFEASARNGNSYASEMLRRMKMQNIKQILYMSQRVLSSIAFSMSMNSINNSHTQGDLNKSNGLHKPSKIKNQPKKKNKFHKKKISNTISH